MKRNSPEDLALALNFFLSDGLPYSLTTISIRNVSIELTNDRLDPHVSKTALFPAERIYFFLLYVFY